MNEGYQVHNNFYKMSILLSEITTDELAAELALRTDLLEADGLLRPHLFQLRAKLGAITCTDGIPVRKTNDVIEGGLIRRNIGKYHGKLCIIGGVVALGETLDGALRRHFRADIGKEIIFLDPRGAAYPIAVYQYYDHGSSDDFLPEPTKHAVALTYLVSISDNDFVFGSSKYGQEALAFEWYSAESCPPAEEFGYDMKNVFLQCLTQVTHLFPK